MVPEIKKVLFATDLSDNARHAFAYAASEATRHGAVMVLIHVIEKSPANAEAELKGLFGEDQWRQMQEAHERTARGVLIGKRTDYDVIRQALADFCADANTGDDRCSFEAQDILVQQGGDVAEEILKAAAEKKCDLIVLGAHRGMFRRTAIGKVTKAVLQRAGIPVLVVPPPKAA